MYSRRYACSENEIVRSLLSRLWPWLSDKPSSEQEATMFQAQKVCCNIGNDVYVQMFFNDGSNETICVCE